MGNTQTQNTFQIRSKLLSTSILKTLTFSTRQYLDRYVHQLRSRMTLRSYYLPRMVYFNQITSPKGLTCQTLPSFKLEVYFQDYGKEYSQQCAKLEQCRCMELLEAIEELKDRYGCFRLSLSTIFVKREENFRKIVVWINNQVQQCNPSNKCDEISMCESVFSTLQILMKDKCFQNYQRLSKEMHKLTMFSMLKQAIIKYHISPVVLIKQEKKQIEDIFTFKYILNQTIQHTSLPAKTSENALFSNNSVSRQFSQAKQVIFSQQPLPQTPPTPPNKSHTQPLPKRQKIPPLNMKSLSEYLNDQNNQQQRVILSRDESIQQIKQLYNEQKEYEDIVTTARSPGRNYIMRKSDQLTIFPNQYQIKFQNKHRINCEAQIKQSFQAFKKAMNTLKSNPNPNPEKPKSPVAQRPIVSYR